MKYLIDYKLYENKTIKDLDNEYSYFHLSWYTYNINSDKKSFTFTPRIPTQPYGFETSIIEDDFTKRISLGKSVMDCLYALPEDYDGTWFIYGTKQTNGIISIKDRMKDCTIVGYGKDFDIIKWISTLEESEQLEINNHINSLDIDLNEIGVSDLPIKYRDLFAYCVPDALETDEYWSLSEITMDYLGYIDQEGDYNVYDDADLNKIVPKFDQDEI